MDRIFDGLLNILRIFNNDRDDVKNILRNSSNYKDPELSKAWEELDSFLNSKNPVSNDQDFNHHKYNSSNRKEKLTYSEDLRNDYAILGVAFGAPISDVKRSYKQLMLSVHPDHVSKNCKQQEIATRTTIRINAAYSRIVSSLYKL